MKETKTYRQEAYYELYYVGRAVGVTAENVELLKQLEEIARSKDESGTAEHGDVIKAQVELDKLLDPLRTLQDFKHPLVARLNAALNRPAESALAFPTNNSHGVLQSGAAQLLEQLRASNPELKSLDLLAEKDRAWRDWLSVAMPRWRPANPAETTGRNESDREENMRVWRFCGVTGVTVGEVIRNGPSSARSIET